MANKTLKTRVGTLEVGDLIVVQGVWTGTYVAAITDVVTNRKQPYVKFTSVSRPSAGGYATRGLIGAGERILGKFQAQG